MELDEDELKVDLQRLYRSLSDSDLDHAVEMNRRHAEGLSSEADMREFCAYLRGYMRHTHGRDIEVTREIARDVAARNVRDLSAERERRQRERPN